MKIIKKLLIIYLFVMFFSILSSCVYKKHVCPDPNPLDYDVTFSKFFFSDSFDELETKIMNSESYINSDLKFYYNLKFLEKYNWTMSPNYLNKNEFIYNSTNSISEIYNNVFYTRSFYAQYVDPTNFEMQYSTPVDVLNTIGKESYYYKYEEPTYKNSRLNFQFYNAEKNEFNYGITYQARTIDPIYLTINNQSELYYLNKVETTDVKICPNMLIPSFEDLKPDSKGFYKEPLVFKEEYENITLACRIYIDDFPIDCLMRIKYCSKFNNINQMTTFLDNLKLDEYINKSYIQNDTHEIYKTELKYTMFNDYDVPILYNYNVHFISFYESNSSNSKLASPYLINYTNILDEYFYSFTDGIEETCLSYRVK